MIARMIARIVDVQKLKQKSQSKSFEIKTGARSIILERKPIFPINKIAKAEIRATAITRLITVVHVSGITL